jgi:Overcoming lysogenization defect protein-like, TOPRIM domain
VTTVLSPTTVIVEGISDRIAVETLAAKLGRDLDGEGIAVVPIGGAQAIGNVLGRLGGETRVAGLCDAGEEPGFRRALERAGLGTDLDRAAMEELGFFVCVRDLEDELIRALGPDVVEAVVEEHGDLRPLRTLQKQAAWHGRPKQDQLRRFMGSGGRRKIRYARFLVEALDPAQVPRPLSGLMAYI